jgi:hypothetical protein
LAGVMSWDNLIKYFLFSRIYIDQVVTVAMGWVDREMKISLCNVFFPMHQVYLHLLHTQTHTCARTHTHTHTHACTYRL